MARRNLNYRRASHRILKNTIANLNVNEEGSGCTCGKREKIIGLLSVLCAMGLYTE